MVLNDRIKEEIIKILDENRIGIVKRVSSDSELLVTDIRYEKLEESYAAFDIAVDQIKECLITPPPVGD